MGLTQTGTYNTRQLQIVIINSILVVLSITAVSLRVWARRLQGLGLFVEDYLSIFALALSLGVNALLFQSLHAGVGEHVDTLSTATVEAYSLNLYVMQLFWNTCLPVIKLSIVLFYQRIFPVRSMIIACRSVMLFLAAWYIAFQTTAIFQCIPIHHEWQKKTTQGKCIAFVPFVTTLAATNLCTDVLLLILPTRQVWKLQIPWGRKVGLSAIFTLGIIVCAISIVRLENLIAISNSDITWSDTYSHLWTAIESSLGVVVSCLPSLMPIVRLVKSRGSRRDGKSLTGIGQGSSYPSYVRGPYELSEVSNRVSTGPTRTRLRAGSSHSDLIRKQAGDIEIITEIDQTVESTNHSNNI
ncbi:hypothetical protein BO94DRAFT_64517 [Aspergillus sclerotioniger CBS 115572]|uniref:Rhodopsin domain-containing protein n=1 Tax=Aspergillus sclerotioniger CBS 115572 TaxID=1450535 RepID=A0A317WNU7_9EURO|nr:hypothetical protein BO94DRAFT_64517 [Aspergillus sclerotioniger CBS 115572]PWY88106.1 hypothetical protein BO94DRAFT_64517 [Aspergillus sclerotioniger CBS 115572]